MVKKLEEELKESARKLTIGIARATKSSMMYGDVVHPESEALALGYITMGVSMAQSMGIPQELVMGALALGIDRGLKNALREQVGADWFDDLFEEYGIKDLGEVNSEGGEA